MSDITLRPAIAEDVPMIHRFIHDLAVFEKLEDRMVSTVEQLQQHLFGPNPVGEVVLAFYEGVPVGFALFFRNFSTFEGRPGIYLEDLFVNESVRGKGVGKLLLKYLAHLAVERNYARVEWAVLDWNVKAIQFYQSLGAVAMTDWTINRLSGEALQALAEQYDG